MNRRLGVAMLIVAASPIGCCLDGVVIEAVEGPNAEVRLIFDEVDGAAIVSNCTGRDREVRLEVELYEQFGTAPVDAAEVRQTLPEGRDFQIGFDGLEPEQTGRHFIRVRTTDDELDSGIFDVI